MPRTSPKKDAVLAIGLDKSTADIVSAASAKGVPVSTTYVDLLKKAQSKTAPKKTSAKPAPSAKVAPSKKAAAKPAKSAKATATGKAKPTVAASKGKAMTKTEYVRSLGDGVMPAEIVERAKKDGIKLTLAYVYNIRGQARRGAKKAKPSAVTSPATTAKHKPGRPKKAPQPSPSPAAPKPVSFPPTLLAMVARKVKILTALLGTVPDERVGDVSEALDVVINKILDY